MNKMLDLKRVIKERGKVMNDKKIALLLGFVCFVLTIAICIQINTVKSSYTGEPKQKQKMN